MGFIALVVFPIALTIGAVSWTIFHKGGFGGFLMSVVVAFLGALVGFFAAPALLGGLGPAGTGIGAALGALLAATLDTIVRWRSPRSTDDPIAKHGPSSPIDDPHVDGPRAPLRPGRVQGSEV